MSEQTKFKVGQVWKDGRGQLSIIENIGTCNMLVQSCDSYFDTSGHATFIHDLDGGYTVATSEHDLVCLVRDVGIENQTIQTDIKLKIVQIEQQLQELKALLKD